MTLPAEYLEEVVRGLRASRRRQDAHEEWAVVFYLAVGAWAGVFATRAAPGWSLALAGCEWVLLAHRYWGWFGKHPARADS